MEKENFDQIKYQNEYNKKNYDRVGFMMPKGKKDIVKAIAKQKGVSLSEYINAAIDEKILREQ